MKKMHTDFWIYSTLLLAIFGGCSGKGLDENNPQAVYENAEEDIQDKHYESALEKMKNVKNKFPYSNYAVRAKLRIADIHFLQESFIESAGAYESFRDLHPKHEKADYVLFQIGESYYFQLPSTIDRDLAPAIKSIQAYKDLKTIYPQSQYIGKASEHMKDSTEKLALKEKYIADFYFIRDQFDSAAKRFEKITVKYPGVSIEEEAYWKWGQSLLFFSELPENLDKKEITTKEAKHVFQVYLSRYPQGVFSKKAIHWLKEH